MLSHPEAPCFLIEENFFRVRESLTREPRHPAEVDRVWKIPDLEKCLARVTSESIKKADASLRPAPAVPDTTSERGDSTGPSLQTCKSIQLQMDHDQNGPLHSGLSLMDPVDANLGF